MKRIETRAKATRLGGFVCMTAMLFAQCALAAVEIDSTVEIPADGLVVVENLAGSIEFSAWDRPEVQIRGDAANRSRRWRSSQPRMESR